jgi:hypothetical protein
MPLNDRDILSHQRKFGHQVGEIRLGTTVVRNEKRQPVKLDTFRLTTNSHNVAVQAAGVLGGSVRQAQLLNGRKAYEVVTSVSELPVMVPPGDAVISQHYEKWTAAGCERRCDGIQTLIPGGPCQCPRDLDMRRDQAKSGNACKPITRLNVMLPDIMDLGVWLVQSTGDNAADELAITADVLKKARDADVIIPATLRMEHRERRIVGEKPRRFVVPVLEINASLRDMVAIGGSQDLMDALPPPPPANLRAIGAGPALIADADDEPIDAEIVDVQEAKARSVAAVGGSVGERLNALDAGSRAAIEAKMQAANFPDPLPSAAEKTVAK